MTVGVDAGLARAAGAQLHIQGARRDTATLQDGMWGYLQGVARLAIARRWIEVFYSTFALSALINN